MREEKAQVVEVQPYLLDTEQAAKFLGLEPGTLSNWRNKGKGPKYVRYSSGNPRSAVRYRLPDLVKYADSLKA